MQIVDRLKTIEQRLEQEVFAFFRLMGASEAPEEWGTGKPASTPPKKQATPTPSDSGSH